MLPSFVLLLNKNKERRPFPSKILFYNKYSQLSHCSQTLINPGNLAVATRHQQAHFEIHFDISLITKKDFIFENTLILKIQKS